ncbi:hypothetical protein [Niastella caeni]|nr:hypothetical protein [Niastella caeni]
MRTIRAPDSLEKDHRAKRQPGLTATLNVPYNQAAYLLAAI